MVTELATESEGAGRHPALTQNSKLKAKTTNWQQIHVLIDRCSAMTLNIMQEKLL